ncbi:MAG: hypothetical protein EPN89_17845 [Methylovulum sp.]|nr:MAG: hypothetical protein EPN89_17845 [Methylovulum sp.]
MAHFLEYFELTIINQDNQLQKQQAFEWGLDFADALHHASYKVCADAASFDDKKFARRATRMGLNPVVVVPQ